VTPAKAKLEDVKTWKLWGAKTGGNQELLLESEDPGNEALYLETGDWDFTLEGYNGTPLLILEGTLKEKAISPDGLNTLEFTVGPVSAEGAGTVKITINLPKGHGITEARVFKGSDELSPITPGGDGNFAYEASHDAGDYFFSFRLYNEDDDLYGVVSELVKVRRNLTSEKTYTLEKEDLNLSYAITFHTNGGAFDGLYPASYRSTDADLELPTPARDGYEFKGWYDNEGLGEDPFTEIPQDSAGDRPFWAKWEEITYPINYELDEKGTNHGDNPTSYNVESPTITLKDPTPSSGDYIFLRWYVDNPNTPVNTIPTGSFGTKTFYAKWHKNGVALASDADIRDYLANAGDGTEGDPIALPVNINLVWSGTLSSIINNAKKFVALDLPEVTSIDNFGAFEGCNFLLTVTSPATNIGDYIFSYCKALTTVDLPNAITIGSSVFQGCEALKEISLPSATSIYDTLFRNTGTTALTVTLGPTAPTLEWGTFSGVTSTKEVTVKVPAAAIANYNGAWKNSFTDGNANIILTIETYVP
jgi:uncharacterized repeat protein (TIGR02543 family)